MLEELKVINEFEVKSIFNAIKNGVSDMSKYLRTISDKKENRKYKAKIIQAFRCLAGIRLLLYNI